MTVEEPQRESGGPSKRVHDDAPGPDQRVGRRPRQQGGVLTQYKAEQGKWTRRGTFIGIGLLGLWGAWSLYDRMHGYEGGGWRLLITPGVPLFTALVVFLVAWRVSFVQRRPSDFMIATEGEMKKVSWSTKREVIGSTKVVIVFTVLLAGLLFLVDLIFQWLFQVVGVLKVSA